MKYVFFDLDGTLTDPAEGITNSVRYAIEKMGLHVRDARDYIKYIGPPLRESFQKCEGMNAEQAEQAIAFYREYYSPRGIFENSVYDGIPELLQKLRDEGYALVTATSKPTVFAKRVLEKFELLKYFSAVFGSELNGVRDRKGEVIAYALSELGIKSSDVVMVGDRMQDVAGAAENEIPCIGVAYGYGSCGELTEAGAVSIAMTVSELYNKITDILK